MTKLTSALVDNFYTLTADIPTAVSAERSWTDSRQMDTRHR